MVAPARTSQFWRLLLWGTALGAFAGLFAIAFLWAETTGRELIWPEDVPTGWLSGEWWWILVPAVAGLVVGLLYGVFRLPERLPGFVEELQAGSVEWRHAPGVIVVSLVSLVGGASLGPEAPLGTAGGAAGSWLADRRGGDSEERSTATFAGMSGAFGGLLSSPLIGTLFGLELEHGHTPRYFFRHLIPGIVAGLIGFVIVFPILGPIFVGKYDLPAVEFEPWHMAAGLAMGVAAAAAAIILGLVARTAGRALGGLRLPSPARGALGGAAVGLIAFALPLTLFSGSETLGVVLDDYADIGIAMLLAVVVAKALALGISIGAGFYGGQFFPIFFMGGTLGTVATILFPDLPLALAVGCMLAGVAAALAPIPLSVIVIAALMLGSTTGVNAAIATSAITAFVITYGFGLMGDVDSGGEVPTAQEGPA